MSNFMLVGGSGTGKTTALTTIPGEVVVVATDVSCLPSLRKVFKAGAPAAPMPVRTTCLHYNEIIPSTQMSWSDLAKSTLPGSKVTLDVGRPVYDLIHMFGDFTCKICGEHIGPLDKRPDITIALDGASGLNDMAMLQRTQGRMQKTQADWGDAMDIEFAVIKMLCAIPNNFVLIAHLTNVRDEVLGTNLLFPDFLGQKLGPRIPRFFNDVVQAVREGSKFYWTNTSYTADLRSGLIPLSARMDPSFNQAWWEVSSDE